MTSAAPKKPREPLFTAEETKARMERLLDCFNACDIDGNGVIEAGELEIVVQAFVPKANVKAEVIRLLSKFDKNGDSKIDSNEWCSVCFELFSGMSNEQFAKHCEKMLNVIQNCAAQRAQYAAAMAAATAAGAGAGSASAEVTPTHASQVAAAAASSALTNSPNSSTASLSPVSAAAVSAAAAASNAVPPMPISIAQHA